MATTTTSMVPMAWDPKSPSSLLIGNKKTNSFGFDIFSSDDGVGANTYETSCLMKLVDSQSDFMSSKRSKSLVKLSQDYRRALRDCLSGWKSDEEASELLQLTYAVTHLSEVFLLTKDQHIPGRLTANMVQYLRLHHLEDIVGSDSVDTLLQSARPDQAGGGSLFWKTLQSLIIRGNLDDAWALLSHHSACQRCWSNTEVLDDYHASIRNQDRDGFTMLRAVLLSAPLPGGRTDLHDDGLEPSDDEDQDKTPLLDGVQRTDYQLWEATAVLGFNPQAAVAVHKRWRKAVVDLGPLSGLLRRIPQLATILNVLKGDFSTVVFNSWAERMCAELLYVRPDLRGDDLHTIAKRCMRGEPLQEVIIGVMEGNAGRVVEALYRLGGSSGAALPATMTALLCKLLAAADPLSFESAPPGLETDLLLSAADAIVSSHSSSRADVGTRLAVGLLLPHARPQGDLRITAALAEIIAHHSPGTDAEAKLLLDLVHPLVAKKSLRVVDGCVNLVLSRYQRYDGTAAAGAVYWLLRGVELEREAYHSMEVGSCSRLLVTSCVTTSSTLLSGLVGDNENLGTTFMKAKDMATSIREDDLDLCDVREVAVLLHIADLATAIVEKRGDDVVASHISACLADGLRNDGAVHVLAHSSMHWTLLRLAYVILNKNEESAPFDVAGMEVLLLRLTELGNHEPKMRLAFAKGLMRAHVTGNAKLKTSMTSTSSHLDGAVSSKLTLYSPADQERIVANMLDM